MLITWFRSKKVGKCCFVWNLLLVCWHEHHQITNNWILLVYKDIIVYCLVIPKFFIYFMIETLPILKNHDVTPVPKSDPWETTLTFSRIMTHVQLMYFTHQSPPLVGNQILDVLSLSVTLLCSIFLGLKHGWVKTEINLYFEVNKLYKRFPNHSSCSKCLPSAIKQPFGPLKK